MTEKYLIIAGTNKAGTTSFYEYLAAHPSVNAAFIKQTFFFLDKEWQQKYNLRSLYDYEKGFEQFDKFFPNHLNGQYKLEASPEYLYAPDTSRRLADFVACKNAQLIFILRDPISRFISLFQYSKQLSLLPRNCTFREFIQLSKKNASLSNTSLMAYETGFYSKYLLKYLEQFGPEKIKVYFFEDMIRNNRNFMKSVSADLGLADSFYDNFSFDQHNKTVAVKNRLLGRAYLKLRGFMIEHTYRSKIGFKAGKLFKKTITPLYRKINMTESKKEKIDDKDLLFLKEVYKEEKQNLQSLLGIEAPW